MPEYPISFVYYALGGKVSAHHVTVSESTTVGQLRSLCYGKLDDLKTKYGMIIIGAVKLMMAGHEATMADVGVVQDTVLTITAVAEARLFMGLTSVFTMYVKTIGGTVIKVPDATADW
jgi:hypothetical protein